MNVDLHVAAAISFAVLNLLAATALAWPTRGTSPQPVAEGAATAVRPRPSLEGDPLAELVREVEAVESAGWRTRGEERLAADLSRWRARSASGEPLPRAAERGRGGRDDTGPWGAA